MKYINSQYKINNRHEKWVKFLQAYTFVFKDKSSAKNEVDDVLSRRYTLITLMHVKVVGFEVVKEFYEKDIEFSHIWSACSKGKYGDFFLQDEFLFKNNCFYIPICPLQGSPWWWTWRPFWARQNSCSHQRQFLLANMVSDVTQHMECYRAYHIAKRHAQNMGLYTPLAFSNGPWTDVSIDFVVGLPKTQRNKDSIMVMVDQFWKLHILLYVSRLLTQLI